MGRVRVSVDARVEAVIKEAELPAIPSAEPKVFGRL
jgi:hypothetical protein